MSWTWQEKHKAEGKLLPRSRGSQRWTPWGAAAGQFWQLGRESPGSLWRPVLLEVAFPLGLLPNGKSMIISLNLRQLCQTMMLLVLYQLFF